MNSFCVKSFGQFSNVGLKVYVYWVNNFFSFARNSFGRKQQQTNFSKSKFHDLCTKEFSLWRKSFFCNEISNLADLKLHQHDFARFYAHTPSIHHRPWHGCHSISPKWSLTCKNGSVADCICWSFCAMLSFSFRFSMIEVNFYWEFSSLPIRDCLWCFLTNSLLKLFDLNVKVYTRFCLMVALAVDRFDFSIGWKHQLVI